MQVAAKTQYLLQSRAPRLAGWLSARIEQSRGLRRKLVADPSQAKGTWSSRRVNALASGMPEARTYLEVGVRAGITLEAVSLLERFGVDPFPAFDERNLPQGVQFFRQTSDRYFGRLSNQQKFDIVFLDGLHQWFQTYKDVVNSLNHLAPNGIILVDDVVPSDHISAMDSEHESFLTRQKLGLPDRGWHGDVYKVMFALRDHHQDVEVRTIASTEDNPQALIWYSGEETKGNHVLAASPREYANLTYDDAFSDGIPQFFQPRDESAAITEALEWIVNHRK